MALVALTACRAFPVGLYVPDTVLGTLAAESAFAPLDEAELARALAERAGGPLELRATDPERLFRLDLSPPTGPFAPTELTQAAGSAADGLRAGDLVLVKHPRAQSLATTLTFGEFTFYDHMGVLVERDERFLVCDSWPRFRPFLCARDFADRFRGGVRASTLGAFLAHYETALLLRLPEPEQAERLAAAALASLSEGIEYDPHHDPSDPRLSCSEYKLHLFERAGIRGPTEPRAVASDAELRRVLAALGFPTTGFVVPDQFRALPGMREVAWFSRHATRPAALAQEVAFALLHARFARGAPLVDFLAIDRFHFLAYRPSVAAFLRWAPAWAERRGLLDPRALADELEPLLPLFFRPVRPRARLERARAPSLETQDGAGQPRVDFGAHDLAPAPLWIARAQLELEPLRREHGESPVAAAPDPPAGVVHALAHEGHVGSGQRAPIRIEHRSADDLRARGLAQDQIAHDVHRAGLDVHALDAIR
jgi:hypothetical protein